jgi:PEP-CTERM motif
MKKWNSAVLFGFALIFSNLASSGIIHLKATYTPTVGSGFYSFFSIDDTGIASGDLVTNLSFSAARSPNEWIQGSDLFETRLKIGSDLVNFSNSRLDGQIYDSVAPAGDLRWLSHDAAGGSFRIYSDQSDDPIDVRGSVSIARIPTPATFALFGLGLAGLGWSRRKKA